jgi:hypothetical protein
MSIAGLLVRRAERSVTQPSSELTKMCLPPQLPALAFGDV